MDITYPGISNFLGYGRGLGYTWDPRALQFAAESPRHQWVRPPGGVATRQAERMEDIRPFLAVPFEEAERTRLLISQGWIYNNVEHPLHPKIQLHKGCDFPRPIGTPVLAAARGIALGSYHFSFLDDRFNRKTGTRDMESGARMAYGLGRFVLIWHPQMGVFTLYGHLQEINRDKVPYFAPVQDGEDWNPTVIMQSVDAMMTSTNDQGHYPQWVERGDPIGIVGVSGLSLEGDGESPSFIPDQGLYPTWDPAGAHLHWELFTRKPDGSGKELRWDPWDIYGEADSYRNVLTSAAQGYFLPDPNRTGWVLFAK